jgi:hypothetical protein
VNTYPALQSQNCLGVGGSLLVRGNAPPAPTEEHALNFGGIFPLFRRNIGKILSPPARTLPAKVAPDDALQITPHQVLNT